MINLQLQCKKKNLGEGASSALQREVLLTNANRYYNWG